MDPATTTPAEPRAPVAREPVIEIVGYLGAAVGLSAAGIALGESASTGVQLVFDAVASVVLFGAGWALGSDDEALGRMKSVFWFLSVFGVAGFVGTLFGETIGLEGKAVVALTGLVVTAYALALWWLSRRSLQVVALFVAALVTIEGLVFPDLGGFIFGPPDLTAVALVSWLFGLAWVGAGVIGAVRPGRTAIVLGSIVAVAGPLLMQAGGEAVVGQVLSLVTAAGLVVLGDRLGERAAAGLGIAGILVVSAIVVGDHVQEQGPAIAVLVLGLVLLGAAIVAARGRRPTEPPAEPPAVPPATSWPPPPPPAPADPAG